ncbi:hypothetical protein D3C80_2061960 [compost metagenome]
MPTTSSVVAKESSGAVPLGMRTTVTCWACTICPKGISVAATTTPCRLSSGLASSRAVSQLLAIQAAPRPSTRERTMRVGVRTLMAVSP